VRPCSSSVMASAAFWGPGSAARQVPAITYSVRAMWYRSSSRVKTASAASRCSAACR
jgi:hypothetical protein